MTASFSSEANKSAVGWHRKTKTLMMLPLVSLLIFNVG